MDRHYIMPLIHTIVIKSSIILSENQRKVNLIAKL